MGSKHRAGGYLTKNSGSPGAGDMLMGFLGSVILSFAFSMYRQRKVDTVEFLTSTALLYSFLLCVTDFKCFCSHRIKEHPAGNPAARSRNYYSCGCVIAFLLVLDSRHWSPSRVITVFDVRDNSSLCYCGFGTSYCQLT